MFRTSQLPEVENQCPECGLRARASAGVLPWPIAASLCKHQPWHKCPKLNLEKLRGDARAAVGGTFR
jgi:hypothetical protein